MYIYIYLYKHKHIHIQNIKTKQEFIFHNSAVHFVSSRVSDQWSLVIQCSLGSSEGDVFIPMESCVSVLNVRY